MAIIRDDADERVARAENWQALAMERMCATGQCQRLATETKAFVVRGHGTITRAKPKRAKLKAGQQKKTRPKRKKRSRK